MIHHSTTTLAARPRSNPRTRALLALALLALCALAAPGCYHAQHISAPPGFARTQLSESGQTMYRFHAVSAYGVALAVRVVENRAAGNLDFWSEAIDREVARRGDYRAVSTGEVRSASGAAGRRMEYSHGDPRAATVYQVTVFLVGDRLYVIEAGGPEAAFARARDAIERAVRDFRA